MLSTLPAQAQWVGTSGPGGGEIRDIVSDGNNLFAAGPSGVWHSIDNGDNWVPYNNFSNGNVFAPYIFSLATDSVNIYAGSINGGQIYTANINNGIWSMATIPGGDINVLKFVGGKLYAGASGGVFMSADSGVTWINFSSGMVPFSIQCMASDGNYLFAGGLDGGLYRLTIGDSIWLPVNNAFANADIRALVIDSNYIYAGTIQSDIKRSSDNGISWASMTTGLPTSFFSVIALAKFDSYIYVSLLGELYRTNNNGISWQYTASGYSQYLLELEAHNTFLFSGSLNKGVQRKQVGSNSWTLQLNGMNNAYVTALSVQGQRLLAATQSGIFRTDDGGNVWNGPAVPCINCDIISIVANDSLVFAGSYNDGIFRSADGGVSWSAVNNGVQVCYWNGTTPNYCRINDLHLLNNYVFATSEYRGVMRSSDMGNTWDTLSNGLTTSDDKRVMAIESIGSNLYIGSFSGNIFVSNDDGSTWTLSNSTFSGSISNLTSVGTHIFASTFATSGTGGVFSYLEGDTAWLPVNLGAWNNNTLFMRSITHAGQFLFVDAGGEMIFSDDLGITWNSVGSSLECYFVKSMVTMGTDVFAAAGVRGVFKNNSLLTDLNEISRSENCFVYPNPVIYPEQIVSLDCEIKNAIKIGLYDLRGGLVRQLKSMSDNKYQFNLDITPPGFYIIRIISSENVNSFKIVIQ